MRGETKIAFRNRKDVRLSYDVDMSGPGTGATVVEWDIDCDDCRRSMRLNPLTPSEEDKILEACVAAASEKQRDDFHDPAEWRD